jgi:hypothetical protein
MWYHSGMETWVVTVVTQWFSDEFVLVDEAVMTFQVDSFHVAVYQAKQALASYLPYRAWSRRFGSLVYTTVSLAPLPLEG